MERTLGEFVDDTMLRGKCSNPEQAWHAGGMGQRESHEVHQSQMQSPAPVVADWQGCTSLEKHLGPWLIQVKPESAACTYAKKGQQPTAASAGEQPAG